MGKCFPTATKVSLLSTAHCQVLRMMEWCCWDNEQRVTCVPGVTVSTMCSNTQICTKTQTSSTQNYYYYYYYKRQD